MGHISGSPTAARQLLRNFPSFFKPMAGPGQIGIDLPGAGKFIYSARLRPRIYRESNEATPAARLSTARKRAVHEPHAARIFSPEAAALAGGIAPGIQRDAAAPAGRKSVRTRYRRSRLAGNRPGA